MSKTAFKISCCKAHFYLFIFSPIDYFNRLFNSNSALRRVVDFQFSNRPSKFRLYYNPFPPPSFPALLSTNFPVSGLKLGFFHFSLVGFSVHAQKLGFSLLICRLLHSRLKLSALFLLSSFHHRLSPPWSRLRLKLLFPFPLKSSAFRFSLVGFSVPAQKLGFSFLTCRLLPSRLKLSALSFLIIFPPVVASLKQPPFKTPLSISGLKSSFPFFICRLLCSRPKLSALFLLSLFHRRLWAFANSFHRRQMQTGY